MTPNSSQRKQAVFLQEGKGRQRHKTEKKGTIFMIGFKRRIIKVMVGAKKSKKLNLKEKTIFRNGNREEDMPRSYEKGELRKTRRWEELFERRNFYHIWGRYAKKKEEMEEQNK